MKRFLPAVLPPYGMPLKTLMSSTTVPRIFPYEVSATTLPVSAARAPRNARNSGARLRSCSKEGGLFQEVSSVRRSCHFSNT